MNQYAEAAFSFFEQCNEINYRLVCRNSAVTAFVQTYSVDDLDLAVGRLEW